MKYLLLVAVLAAVASAALPTSFDARTKWPGCAAFILNQEDCGSCWDFCSMESFADRMCITGEVAAGTIISPEPILDCSRQGCNGGNPSTAWNWVINNGDTTCTSQCFNGCQPYDSGAGTSPACHAGTCDSGSKWPVTYYGGSFKSLTSKDPTLYQTELSNNGPLQACFNVYNNFYTYFSLHPNGIYTSYSGSLVGGHCVKMIGWGTTSGQDYWLFANSWDTTWADGGFFKMARGTDLCGIENQVSEGFTKKQIAVAGFTGIHENTNTTFIVGGWHQQEDPTVDFVMEAAVEGVKQLSKTLGRELQVKEIISAETQVVAGVNFKLNVLVSEGEVAYMKIHRDLKFQFYVREYKLLH